MTRRRALRIACRMSQIAREARRWGFPAGLTQCGMPSDDGGVVEQRRLSSPQPRDTADPAQATGN